MNIGEIVNDIADKITSMPIVSKIGHNPIYTALLIVFIMIICILIVFRNEDFENSYLTLLLRVGSYAFIFILVVVFIYNKIIISSNMEKYQADEFNKYGGIPNTPIMSSGTNLQYSSPNQQMQYVGQFERNSGPDPNLMGSNVGARQPVPDNGAMVYNSSIPNNTSGYNILNGVGRGQSPPTTDMRYAPRQPNNYSGAPPNIGMGYG